MINFPISDFSVKNKTNYLSLLSEISLDFRFQNKHNYIYMYTNKVNTNVSVCNKNRAHGLN